jgi:cell division protein FtsL
MIIITIINCSLLLIAIFIIVRLNKHISRLETYIDEQIARIDDLEDKVSLGYKPEMDRPNKPLI